MHVFLIGQGGGRYKEEFYKEFRKVGGGTLPFSNYEVSNNGFKCSLLWVIRIILSSMNSFLASHPNL